MKKIFLACLVCFFILVKVSYSAIIEVGVTEILDGEVTSIIYDNSSNVVKFSTEFYNTGSVGYKARIKIEVFNDSELVFVGWSKEKVLMPGGKEVFDSYWYGDRGKYSMKVKTYFGNEIKDYKKFEVELNRDITPEDVFEIKDFRTYDNFVIFDIKSKVDTKDVVIIPSKYTYGWIFEQEKIDSMPENSSKTVIMKYYPTVWNPDNVNLTIVAERGKYYSEKTFEMKKIEGLKGLFLYLIDKLKILVFRLS